MKSGRCLKIMRNWIAFNLIRFGLSLLRGGEVMSVVYASLIVKGVKTFAQVPVKLQPEVKSYLTALDLDENGNPV
ncbi:hypothetical protein D3C74_261640 [compost metagenome]